MKHCAVAWDRKIKLEVLMIIPAKRSNSISRRDPQSLQSVRQAVCAPVVITVPVAMHPTGRARYDFFVWKQLSRALEKMVQC
jgi:hypothetical protein